MSAGVNYLEKYQCSSCSVDGMKLWRPIHGLSGWLCARCATDIERSRLQDETDRHLLSIWPFDTDGNFTFSAGDQLGDMLPAVPTVDGSEVYGYGSVPEERARWWHAMPTHADTALEIRCLRNLLLRSMAQLNGMTEMYLQSIRRWNAAHSRAEP